MSKESVEACVRVCVCAARVNVQSGSVKLGPSVNGNVGLRKKQKGRHALRFKLMIRRVENSRVGRLSAQSKRLKDKREVVKRRWVIGGDVRDDMPRHSGQFFKP